MAKQHSRSANVQLVAILIMVLLSACTATAPSGGGTGLAKAGQYPISARGSAFVAEVRPGNPGLIISKQGATAVTGLTVQVSRQGTALGQDEGKTAKDAAVAACGQAGGRFDDRAVGRVGAPGVWVFEGACG